MIRLKILMAMVPLVVIIFAESIGLIYLAHRSQDLSKKIKELPQSYQQMTAEKDKETEEAVEKYKLVLKEVEELKKDRDNVLIQSKKLMADRTKLNETLDSMKKFEEEKKKIFASNEELQKKLDEYSKLFGEKESAIERLNGENNKLKLAYKKAKEAAGEDLHKRIEDLEKENSILQKKSLDIQGKIVDVSKKEDRSASQLAEINLKYKKLREEYAEALKKNKRLEQEAKNIPKKFAEIARQNTRLTQETAKMHYNLGVFYTKKKEFERAITEFEKVVDLNPDDGYAYFNLGYIYAEYILDRKKAVENFRHYMRVANGGDKDLDWVRKYVLTWETYDGKRPME